MIRRLIILLLIVGCATEFEEELPNELSLDWILLKRGGDNNLWHIESCDGYIECDYDYSNKEI